VRLLIDECVPRKLKFLLSAAGHECETVRDAGLGGLTNGELLAQTELLFNVRVTIDRNMRYQQNFATRKSQSWYCAPTATI
jgi:predicted nuclease of predicted toxin-antitoxin system